ncbi:uncharacterized protein N0V89_000635 [Didymosphaeria variabile]|uniref:RNase H type-1 domain-containing protein n=1 Tax=Didymosphaeria variabile TaxID=1932322 RepID=A0A9W8XVK2_9PLEO|nr:uncharacterized protein N0V89_000635 [Didymosphaeria variabile]KAJ4360076.1 hypothetical protein N0V89_000635 [Didymosphaeria variabile]
MTVRSTIRGQQRRRAIVQRLIGGQRFRGTIVVDEEEAHKNDDERLKDLIEAEGIDAAFVEGIKPRWEAYFTDGSAKNDRLGACVAVLSEAKSKIWHLGTYTGKSMDAELFAIAAALGMALDDSSSSNRLRRVRIYTDAATILAGLSNSGCWVLGPIMDTNEPLAIQLVYDRAEALYNLGVDLELVWVKAHKNSYMNHIADIGAKQGAKHEPPDTQPPQGKTFEIWKAIPKSILGKGLDVVQEWRLRGNQVDSESKKEAIRR